jgi:hypothetical protein
MTSDVWVTPSTWPSFTATSIGLQDNIPALRLKVRVEECIWGTDAYLRCIVQPFGDCHNIHRLTAP